MSDKLIIIPLPPVNFFPKPPVDQPGCEIIPCPQCACHAWISAKKRLRLVRPHTQALCYDCLSDNIKERKGVFQDVNVIGTVKI